MRQVRPRSTTLRTDDQDSHTAHRLVTQTMGIPLTAFLREYFLRDVDRGRTTKCAGKSSKMCSVAGGRVRRASLAVPWWSEAVHVVRGTRTIDVRVLKAMQAKHLKRVALELAKPCKTQASKRRRTRRYARRRADEQLRPKTTVSTMERPARKTASAANMEQLSIVKREGKNRSAIVPRKREGRAQVSDHAVDSVGRARQVIC
jgi:hypothetical protein